MTGLLLKRLNLYLGKGAWLPHKLARHSSAHISSQQAFGIHLIIHMYVDEITVACDGCQFLQQGGLARTCPNEATSQECLLLDERQAST